MLNIAIAFAVGIIAGAGLCELINRCPTSLREDAPTVRQMRYAKRLFIKVPPDCTREQLSALIERRLKG